MKYLKTQPHEDGGIGHQFMNWQLGAILAEKWGCEFVHSNLDSHRSGGPWDDFLNFGQGYAKESDVRNLSVRSFPKIDLGFYKSREVGEQNIKKLYSIVQNGGDGVVYKLPHSHFPGIVSEDLNLLLSSLRRKYFQVHNDPTEDEFVVSLHLRRGDIDSQNNSNRWLDNEFYIKWIDDIKTVLDDLGLNSKFVLFSTTGRTGEFSDFQSFVELRIDGNPFDDFNYMVYSNLLFSGLSSYSILAATLNKNYCVYCPLETYTLWMKDENKYINSYESDREKLKKWILRIKEEI